MNQEEIGRFIAKKRKEKNLTQKELADKLFISEKTVSKWETGNGLPEVSNMQPLCDILNITVTDLLNGGTKEDKTIEYIKYKDKKDRRILIYVILSALVIITLLITNQILTYRNFYKTNYDKTQVTKLYGSGELFDVNNMLLITSPEKTIMVTGRIYSKNPDLVPQEKILSYSINYNDKLILSKGNPIPTVVEEKNGYNDMFNDEKLKNLDNWSITIFYQQGEESKKEVIELDKEVILSTDKLEKEEIEPIGIEEPKTSNKSSSILGKRLVEKGFIETSENIYELKNEKYSLLIDLISGDIFYNDSNTSLICKDFAHSYANIGTMVFDINDKYYIEVIDGKLKCNEEGKCDPKKEAKAKEVYKIVKEYFE